MTTYQIINNEIGTRWDIIKQGDDTYTARYYEMCAGEWRYILEETGYTKESLEWDFDIKVA